MITWATDYWYLCLAALIIGVLTAAWIWLSGRSAHVEPDSDVDDIGVIAPPAPQVPPQRLEPAKPVIEVAKPVAFTAPPRAPAPVAAPAGSDAPRPNIPQAVGDADDLTLIKGVGPKLNALLISLGVLRFDQIAAWGAAEIAEVDGFLGNFKGRITRDSWVEQAGFLATGDKSAFEAKFGTLGSENKS